jgi:hypothetical protein
MDEHFVDNHDLNKVHHSNDCTIRKHISAIMADVTGLTATASFPQPLAKSPRFSFSNSFSSLMESKLWTSQEQATQSAGSFFSLALE